MQYFKMLHLPSWESASVSSLILVYIFSDTWLISVLTALSSYNILIDWIVE